MANKTEVIAEPGKQEIIIKRTFDAPIDKVWKAWTNPELIKQWLGPKGYEMIVKKFEAKAGGSYRYIHKDKEGNEYGFHGVIHGLHKPNKIIQTFEFEGMPEPGHVAMDTLLLKEADGKTETTTISVYQTVEDRDGMISSGMEKGLSEGYEQLDELLAKS